MRIFHKLSDLPEHLTKPVILTIGMFDGVHLGHQKILEIARTLAARKDTQLFCITFKNHPITVLRPGTEVAPLYPLEKKIALLKSYGVDLLLIEEFTKALASQTAESFLKEIYQKTPFSDLVLGYNATLGSDQTDNRTHVVTAAKTLGVDVHSIDKVIVNGQVVSSSLIRDLFLKGELSEAKKFLGR